ncbi:MAG: 16S rRNA (guanine(527)-N(7))-methyltransferase RsmG [Treponemataceae bacterium]
MATILERGLAELSASFAAKGDGVSADLVAAPRVLDLLCRYIAEIELFNPAYGLVGAKDRDELVVKHILDSIAPLSALRDLLPPGLPIVADAGSGAGLPGIPLAICMPDINFALLERMGRRVGFLNNVVAVLGLTNVDVEQTEVERGAAGRYDLVTFRAFRPLDPPMLKALFRLLSPRGVLAAYKAREEKVAEEMSAIESLVGSWEEVETPVPFLDEQRRLVSVRPPR